MFSVLSILFVFKCLIGVVLVCGVILAPAYLAQINDKDKYDILLVRLSSWLLGWTGIGWLFALYWAVKK